MQNKVWDIYSLHTDTIIHKVHFLSEKVQTILRCLRVRTLKANSTIPEQCRQRRFNLWRAILAHRHLTVLLKPRRYRKACWKGNSIKKSLADRVVPRVLGCLRRIPVHLGKPYKLWERLRRPIWGIRSLQEVSSIDTISN